MPFQQFLARVRQLFPLGDDEHYCSVARDLESGALRHPVQPMSDSELAAAIAEFRKTPLSEQSRNTLRDAFNPKKSL
ncbi:hypothetical protein SAMN03159423_0308 [Bradyrhizobium sp. NFR13]|jgi:hypothetical protein|nr:hypothetical protein SAMN03159423_0308 [Bradyrhizobium sp. NFR13]